MNDDIANDDEKNFQAVNTNEKEETDFEDPVKLIKIKAKQPVQNYSSTEIRMIKNMAYKKA